ncbi:MAG: DUF551 domain-containing protein [Klebsiella grimontii]|nr:DUF551 domain-containing protein [Klebsiella grimontii]MDU4310953.1 DUF551 domain-containing protein [Klebsiella michiganensis]
MTKSTITRERLQELAAGQSGFNLRIATHEESQELARMALTAMDSEPDCNERQLFCSTDTSRMRKVTSVSAGSEATPLHRHAQPAPVVPDEINSASAPEVFEIAAEAERLGLRGTYASYAVGWNACRAAMLAAAPQSPGSEPATVPGKWIPVSEQMPEAEGHYLVWANASRIDGYCDHLAIATYQGGKWSNEFNWLVTHWMPLPAAPQEVKGE